MIIGPLAKAVQASCSVPILFTPTELNNKLLTDGKCKNYL